MRYAAVDYSALSVKAVDCGDQQPSQLRGALSLLYSQYCFGLGVTVAVAARGSGAGSGDLQGTLAGAGGPERCPSAFFRCSFD